MSNLSLDFSFKVNSDRDRNFTLQLKYKSCPISTIFNKVRVRYIAEHYPQNKRCYGGYFYSSNASYNERFYIDKISAFISALKSNNIGYSKQIFGVKFSIEETAIKINNGLSLIPLEIKESLISVFESILDKFSKMINDYLISSIKIKPDTADLLHFCEKLEKSGFANEEFKNLYNAKKLELEAKVKQASEKKHTYTFDALTKIIGILPKDLIKEKLESLYASYFGEDLKKSVEKNIYDKLLPEVEGKLQLMVKKVEEECALRNKANDDLYYVLGDEELSRVESEVRDEFKEKLKNDESLREEVKKEIKEELYSVVACASANEICEEIESQRDYIYDDYYEEVYEDIVGEIERQRDEIYDENYERIYYEICDSIENDVADQIENDAYNDAFERAQAYMEEITDQFLKECTESEEEKEKIRASAVEDLKNDPEIRKKAYQEALEIMIQKLSLQMSQ